MHSLAVRFAVEPRRKQQVNRLGANYWHAYTEEVLSCIGVSADPVDITALHAGNVLSSTGVLVLGSAAAMSLPPLLHQKLSSWVAEGGILIGFATEGADGLFGVSCEGEGPQTGDAFSIGGYFELNTAEVNTGCRPALDPDQKLLIVSPTRLIRCSDARELARLFLCDSENPNDGALSSDSGRPAITHRKLGQGHAFYFAFDVAQTMWAIHQGRPVDADYDGDGYHRVSDACVIGDNSRRVPYADALLFLLTNMIGQLPVPMLYPVPPSDGAVAPALLFFGGDDEGAQDVQVIASDFMAQHGLPYHINVMLKDGVFGLGPEEQRHIEANGHEIALHYNFIDDFDHPCGFTQQDVAQQAAAFRETFGRDSVCTVMHWCRWTGWAEPARWFRDEGGRADNSRIHWTSPPLNPTNRIGFAFGSAFPRYVWDDAEHANERIDFLTLPIVAYEVGYDQETCFPEAVRDALAIATQHHYLLNFFWHPMYVATFPACQQAVDELTRLLAEMPVPPVLMTPDQVTEWWDARRSSAVEACMDQQGRVEAQVQCRWPEGLVLRIPTGDRPAASVRVDRGPARFDVWTEFGRTWALVPVPEGQHSVTIDLSPP